MVTRFRTLSLAFVFLPLALSACGDPSKVNSAVATTDTSSVTDGTDQPDVGAPAEDTTPGPGVDTVVPTPDSDGSDTTVVVDTWTPPECNCDDGNACTTDDCSPEGVCSHGAAFAPECEPALVIDSPARGQTIIAAEPYEVDGTATSPAGGAAKLTINEQEIPTGSDGAFAVSLYPSHGINVIEAVASDDGGFHTSVTQSVLIGDAFYPTQDGRGSDTIVGDGIQAWLGSDFWDDGDPSDLDDFSAIAAAILEGTDIMAFLPQSITGAGEAQTTTGLLWCEWTLAVTGIDFEVGAVQIRPVSGGLELEATLENVVVGFSAVAGSFCPDAIGDATIDSVAITGTFTVALSGSGGILVDAPALEVQIVEPVLNITDGFASYFNWIFNWFNGTFANVIEAAFEMTVQEYLKPSIQEALESFTVFSKTLTLPSLAGITKPVDVTFAVEPTTIEIDSLGMKIGLGASIVAENGLPQDITPPPGSLARQDCLGSGGGTFELPGTAPFALAVHDDLLNQLLFGAFYGGLLHLDIPGKVIADKLGFDGVDIGTISLRPLLPPVITSCPSPGTLTVQLGDFLVSASLNLNGKEGTIAGYIFASADVTIKAIPGADGGVELGLGIAELDTFTFQVTDATGALDGSESVIELLFREVAKSLVQDAVGKGFLQSFPLPKFDISSFASGLPSITLGFLPEEVSIDSGFTLITGAPTN